MYAFNVSASPFRARSKSLAARSSAAGGSSEVSFACSAVPFVTPARLDELGVEALGSAGADIVKD